MWTYILQTIAFQLIFLLVYELFLKKETFFSYNRAYLLLTPVVALLLPLLKIPLLQGVVPAETFMMLPEVYLGGSTEPAITESPTEMAAEAPSALNYWLLLYAGGFLFSLGFFFNKFRILRQLFAYKPIVQNAEMKIVEVPGSKIACTFYNTVFLGDGLSEKEREQILSHELVHVRQKHTLDLLFFEILRIVFWFNPLIYVYQSRISALHEYLADAGVVKNVKKQDYFQQLLNSAFYTEDISFINQFFNHSIIKKRIVMLQKSRSKSTSKFKFLIILPLMLAMLTYVACSEDPVVSPEEQEDSFEEKLLQIKAIAEDGITTSEKEEINRILSTVGHAEMERHMETSRDVVEVVEEVAAGTGDAPLETGRDVVEVVEEVSAGTGDVPFAVIEDVPVFPGCEGLDSNEERKNCMSKKITAFVNTEFNTTLGKQLGLEGINRIYVQFKIAKDGRVEVLGARAPHPALQREAERVVSLLPQMVPGKQNGQEVGVLYTLPITFNVGE